MTNVPGVPEIRDVKPPVDWPAGAFWPWAVFSGVVVLVFLAGLLWWIDKRRRKMRLSLNPKTPWELAYEQLAALGQWRLERPEQFQAYYIELSAIVRWYMESRFAIHAPEMTTEEFMNYLKIDSQLNSPHKETLKNFLNACDMVKFARYGPTEQEARESLGLARKLIEETTA